MLIIFAAVVLIYIWRIVKASHKGLIDEVGSLADIVIISFAVIVGIVVIDSIIHKNLIGFLVSGIILLVILIAKKIIRTIFMSLQIIAKLPLLSSMNKLLGFLAGVVEATVLVWVIFSVVSYLRIPIQGEFLPEMVAENTFLNFLYEHNLLYNSIQKIIQIFTTK